MIIAKVYMRGDGVIGETVRTEGDGVRPPDVGRVWPSLVYGFPCQSLVPWAAGATEDLGMYRQSLRAKGMHVKSIR